MKRYRVKQDCYGFENRYWKKDDVVELSDKATPPPEHFELLGQPSAKPAPAKQPLVTPKPFTGMKPVSPSVVAFKPQTPAKPK